MFKWKFGDVKKAMDAQKALEKSMTLEQVRDEMLQCMAGENANRYRLGQLFNYTVDNNLAENAGYKSAPDYFRKHLVDVSPATLAAYGLMAKSFSEAIALRFGVTCLCLLLTYQEAADVKVDHENPGSTVIEVPGKEGAVTAKPFGQCSVDEMRKALVRKRKPASSKPVPKKDVTRVDQVRRAVTGRFAKEDPIRVQVRNHKGDTVVDFKGIPLSKLSKLAEALLAQAPGASTAQTVETVEGAPPVV
jgi:hypothetical protein